MTYIDIEYPILDIEMRNGNTIGTYMIMEVTASV